MTNNSRI